MCKTRNCSRTPGSGRKGKKSARRDRFITKRSKWGTPTKKQLSDEIHAQNGINVSSKTQQRHLEEKGIKWRKKFRKQFVSENNHLARISFAREHNG